MNRDYEIKLVRLASLIALVGNTLICTAKIGIGIYTGSLAVLGDGFDSSTDVLVSIMTLFVSFVISRPSDKEHPWGHQRAETIASVILAFIIFTAGFQLFLVSIKKLYAFYNGSLVAEKPHIIAIAVTLVSIIMKLFLALNQHYLGKKAKSLMIQSNAKNMANDVILSVSVLAGLGISYFFKKYVFDSITAIFVSIWIMHSGIKLFIELNRELMDGNTNKLVYKELFDAVNSIHGVYNPHRARIRNMANLLDIDLDIEVEPEMTVLDAHRISEQVASEIKTRIKNVYDVMIHIEPHGIDNNESEGFGLRETDI